MDSPLICGGCWLWLLADGKCDCLYYHNWFSLVAGCGWWRLAQFLITSVSFSSNLISLLTLDHHPLLYRIVRMRKSRSIPLQLPSLYILFLIQTNWEWIVAKADMHCNWSLVSQGQNTVWANWAANRYSKNKSYKDIWKKQIQARWSFGGLKDKKK